MAMFQDKKWEVVPQMVDNVFHRENFSRVGYLLTATIADGSVLELVNGHGIGSSGRDHAAAHLLSVSKGLFNAAEAILLGRPSLTPDDEEAATLLRNQSTTCSGISLTRMRR